MSFILFFITFCRFFINFFLLIVDKNTITRQMFLSFLRRYIFLSRFVYINDRTFHVDTSLFYNYAFYLKISKMYKLFALFLVTILISVSYSTRAGGYSDHPELINDPTVKGLVVYVAESLASSENLFLVNLKVTGVQTQVVAGRNYKINFTADSVNGGQTQAKQCETVVYVRFDQFKSITSAKCH